MEPHLDRQRWPREVRPTATAPSDLQTTDGLGPLDGPLTSPSGGNVWVTTNATGGSASFSEVTQGINPNQSPISSVGMDLADRFGKDRVRGDHGLYRCSRPRLEHDRRGHNVDGSHRHRKRRASRLAGECGGDTVAGIAGSISQATRYRCWLYGDEPHRASVLSLVHAENAVEHGWQHLSTATLTWPVQHERYSL